MTRKPYPSDVSDEERAFVAPSLTFDRRRPAARGRAAPPPAGGGERGGRLHRPRFGRLSASHGSALVHDAQRSAAVVRRLSANPALAEGRGRCNARP